MLLILYMLGRLVILLGILQIVAANYSVEKRVESGEQNIYLKRDDNTAFEIIQLGSMCHHAMYVYPRCEVCTTPH